MKLTYRGNSYDALSQPAPKMGETIDTGNYRGAPITFEALAELPAQPAADLTWRGVPHRTGIAAPVAAIAPVVIAAELPAVAASLVAPAVESEPAPVNLSDLARNLFIRRHQRSRRREQGMMVRLAAEVGISVEDAAHYESHIQGKMPHDFSGYDRGSAAMS
ncbi:DUF4278 domain-containing protein [Phormidium tenue]|uniref:DUF4278 domain-containing protein n=1 Tax=Phormidium tenue NIES-30 TaxID=549789 RepID=A0A1U7J6Z7_9CYAN|nr:DUF4278 domain-containing protein [Phormidium tenue]MBD2232289.1 DUF4278 domain-containing protein [Phormidium tenue FACHB-1052]OKH48774.1 hypothetical protein NIES30_09585 [Phormidium tenue NIES-30]